jgi:hypothetical protein
VGSVPDRGRRWRARWESFRRGGTRSRLEILASLLLPPPVKSALRRWLGRTDERLVYLEYDLAAVGRALAAEGLDCRVVEFPPDFWSRDFRLTRSNLLVSLPGEA